MTVTGRELVERGVRRIGGITGTLGTVAVGGSTTTVVLNGLIGTTLDDTAYAGSPLFFSEAPAGSDYSMTTAWDDSLGRATIANLATAPVAGERYAIQLRGGNYTLGEFEEALRKCLRYARRTYRYVIPTTPLLELYPLSRLDWLEGAGSVDAVWWSDSPLMLHNEDMALWQNGSAAAPDGYTLVGAGASVARVSTGIRSAYAAQVTAGGGAAAYLEQSIPGSLVQWLTRRAFPVFTPLRGAGWVSTTAANAARVGIYDGTTTTYSDYVTGDGVPHFPHVSVTPDADMTDFRLRLEVAAGQTATWSFAGLMQSTVDWPQAYDLRDRGSQARTEMPFTNHVRNIGGVPTVELRSWPGTYGQLIVYSRRPFPELTDLDDVFEDQYARAIEAGMLRYLLDAQKPNQDRARLDRVMEEEAARWVAFLQQNVSLPVGKPLGQQVVGSA